MHHQIIGSVGTVAGIVTLAFTAWWAAMPLPSAAPLHGRYGNNAVLAVELAQTPAELAVVIGPDPPSAEHAAIRARLDDVNEQDFVYMLAYGALLAAGFLLLAPRNRPLALSGVVVVTAAVLGDALENRTLLALTHNAVDVDAGLAALRRWTLLK